MAINNDLLYLQIAGTLEHQVRCDVLKTGDKLPSLRTVSHERGVSLSTVQEAYYELERRGLIESRPQSGYYVCYNRKQFPDIPSSTQPVTAASTEAAEAIINKITLNSTKASIHLAAGAPHLSLLPVAKLNKAITNALRSMPDSGIYYDNIGNLKLKKQIARRALLWGGELDADDIITTSGGMEALAFSMQAVTKPGDAIAVESPVFFGILQLARSLGLRVFEIATHPVTGIDPDALKKAIKTHKIKLCLLVANFSNPLGSLMPDEHKKAVVRLLDKHNIPLIEDDLYGDLYHGDHRPSTCKSFDESGIVLWSGSFSKTLAPGYRVGWVAAGKFKEQVERIKRYHSGSCNTLAHEAIASFLENDRYENHLRKLRQTLHRNTLQFLGAIGEYFPDKTRVSRPQGGFHLWIELSKKTDTLDLYNRAIKHKISISPGRLYTLGNQYTNCLRMGTGILWNEQTENAIKLVGKLSCN